MFRSVLVAALVSSSVSFAADSAGRALKGAADAVEDAFDRTKRSNPACRQSIGAQLDILVDQVDELRRGTTDQQLNGLRQTLSQVGASAARFGCPLEVNDDVHKAVAYLDDARAAMWTNNNRGNGRDDRRHRHGGEPFFTDNTGYVQLSELTIDTRSRVEQENAVRVTVPELKAFNLKGTQFYLAAKFRSYEGDWSDWVTTQLWTIPTDSYSWKNAFTHFYRYSTLAEDDFSRGRFIAHVSVFDREGRELAFHEARFDVRLPNLPNAPPPSLPPPPTPMRDCGTGQDPGCLMTRDGQYPMDATTFSGVISALRSSTNEMMRAESTRRVLASQCVTALQMTPMLDLFSNEMIRFRVAEFAAPKVVNPQHALGYASRFTNSTLGQGFVQLMTNQPQGGLPGNQPPQVVVPVPMPNYPTQPPPGVIIAAPPTYRDCGTGTDPGCTMTRRGQLPMDAATFAGVMTALRTNSNELVRADLCNSLFNANYMTAAHLGQVLDLFNNELTRLDVAKKAADHVVNPQHALALATKFRNTFSQQDFVRVMTAQK